MTAECCRREAAATPARRLVRWTSKDAGPGREGGLLPDLPTEVLLCLIRSATPPYSPSGRRPCCSCRGHGTTALHAHAEVLPALAEWTDEVHAVLGDLGYQGERAALTTPIKHPSVRRLNEDQRTVNLLHAATHAPAERGNSLLKTTFKALRRVSLCPWRIGAITAAALVLLHHQHDRTT
jgi:hypothetical protein